MHKVRKSACLFVYTFMSVYVSGQSGATGQSPEPQFQVLSDKEVLEVLGMLSAKIRGNDEKLLTWESDVDFVLDMYYRGEQAASVLKRKGFDNPNQTETPRSLRRRKTGVMRFILDKPKKCHYEKVTRTLPIRYIDSDDSELGSESGPYEGISILTPESYTDCLALMPDGQTIGHATRIGPVSGDTMTKKGIFDPRSHLKLGMPIWEYLDRLRDLYKKSERPQIGGRSIEVQSRLDEGTTEFGIVSSYVQGSPAEGGNPMGYMVLRFSGGSGFNLAAFELTTLEKIVLQRVEWDYTILDGVTVPTKMRRYNYTPDGALSYQATYVFRNQKINPVVDAATFTYRSLQLLDGDVIHDEIANKQFRYEAASQTLTPIESP